MAHFHRTQSSYLLRNKSPNSTGPYRPSCVKDPEVYQAAVPDHLLGEDRRRNGVNGFGYELSQLPYRSADNSRARLSFATAANSSP